MEEGKGGGRKEVLVVWWRRLSRRLPDRIVSFKNMSNPTLCVLLRCLTPSAGMKNSFPPLSPLPTNRTPTTPSRPVFCVTINSLHSFELTQSHTHTHTPLYLKIIFTSHFVVSPPPQKSLLLARMDNIHPYSPSFYSLVHVLQTCLSHHQPPQKA